MRQYLLYKPPSLYDFAGAAPAGECTCARVLLGATPVRNAEEEAELVEGRSEVTGSDAVKATGG